MRRVDFLDSKPVTEQIYVHSKMMIVDDLKVLIGSANINDRSMVGSRDTELCAVIETISSKRVLGIMNGSRCKISPFARDLRLYAWKTILGLNDTHSIMDPSCDEVYNGIWRKTAQNNWTVYQKLVEACNFCPLDIRKLSELNVKKPDWIFTDKNYEVYLELVSQLRGFLIPYPLEFLKDEPSPPFWSVIKQMCL